MKTKALYLYDSYIKEFQAEVIKVEGNKVILNQTAFYPTSGGVDHDTGKLVCNNVEYTVLDVVKEQDEIVHLIDKEGIKVGDAVQGILDWERRYRLMRMHTAAHLLSAVFYKELNALITGNQLQVDKSRIDFSVDKFDRDLILSLVNKANELIKLDSKVKVYFVNRHEALKEPGLVKLAEAQPPEVEEIRIVEIEGIDKQADGGPHVSHLGEIGNIEVLKLENKGRTNRRIYFSIKP